MSGTGVMWSVKKEPFWASCEFWCTSRQWKLILQIAFSSHILQVFWFRRQLRIESNRVNRQSLVRSYVVTSFLTSEVHLLSPKGWRSAGLVSSLPCASVNFSRLKLLLMWVNKKEKCRLPAPFFSRFFCCEIYCFSAGPLCEDIFIEVTLCYMQYQHHQC